MKMTGPVIPALEAMRLDRGRAGLSFMMGEVLSAQASTSEMAAFLAAVSKR